MSMMLRSIKLENFYGESGTDLYWNDEMPCGKDFIEDLINGDTGTGEHRSGALCCLYDVIKGFESRICIHDDCFMDLIPRPSGKFFITIECSPVEQPEVRYRWHLNGYEHKGFIVQVNEEISISDGGTGGVLCSADNGYVHWEGRDIPTIEIVDNGWGRWLHLREDFINKHVTVSDTDLFSTDSLAGILFWYKPCPSYIKEMRKCIKDIAERVDAVKDIEHHKNKEFLDD